MGAGQRRSSATRPVASKAPLDELPQLWNILRGTWTRRSRPHPVSNYELFARSTLLLLRSLVRPSPGGTDQRATRTIFQPRSRRCATTLCDQRDRAAARSVGAVRDRQNRRAVRSERGGARGEGGSARRKHCQSIRCTTGARTAGNLDRNSPGRRSNGFCASWTGARDRTTDGTPGARGNGPSEGSTAGFPAASTAKYLIALDRLDRPDATACSGTIPATVRLAPRSLRARWSMGAVRNVVVSLTLVFADRGRATRELSRGARPPKRKRQPAARSIVQRSSSTGPERCSSKTRIGRTRPRR
jgi:hypothetical protein